MLWRDDRRSFISHGRRRCLADVIQLHINLRVVPEEYADAVRQMGWIVGTRQIGADTELGPTLRLPHPAGKYRLDMPISATDMAPSSAPHNRGSPIDQP